MATVKIKFAKEKETMLMTLYGRAVQSRWKNPIVRDPWAEDAIQRIDYEFDKNYKGIFGKIVLDLGCMIVATRAATFDRITKQYLEEHPDAVVIYLGCGMDSRVYRVDPPAGVAWYNVDYPDVIDLYRQLYPERPGLHLIGSSLENSAWLDEVPKGRSALVIAEGVFMYLKEADVKALLNALVRHFPRGQIVFDTLAPWIVKRGTNVGETGASYKWTIDDPREIQQLEPRLDFIREYRTSDLVGFSRIHLVIRALHHLPRIKRMHYLLVYRF